MTSADARFGTGKVTLPSDREILITRTFDAPASLVFDAWTTPNLVRRWWGGGSAPLVLCDIDLRVGGEWHYAMVGADGERISWRGTYLAVDPPLRLRSTEIFAGQAESEAQNTLTLTERHGITELAIRVEHTSAENRDRHLESGVEAGIQRSLDQVAVLLAELQAPGPANTPEGSHE